jgi:mannitol-1-phosphate/altronate dehydrogenase
MLKENLGDALALGAKVPNYDRSAIAPSTVHFGVGGFHRAHQGVYLDELARRGVSREWGVIGVGLRSAGGREELRSQDWLYSVLERSPRGDAARVVGIMRDYLFAPRQRAAVLDALARPQTKLVTVTVTGEGYGLDEDGELGAAPLRDLAEPARPDSLLGYLVEGLRRRRDRGIAPFTVLSCDNLPRNGATARAAAVAFARMRDERLADWIEANVAFPSSVVDRITPEATAEHRLLLERRFGLADRWPTVSEDFSQWIVEDDFCNARPPLEEVGARFVADVTPYELSKKRLLNGTHCALGYLGYLCGYERIDAAMADPLLRDYAESLMDEEVGPLLPDMLGLDLDDYKRTLLARFANPRIADPLMRLAGRGSTKMPAYLLPSLREAIDLCRPHRRLTLAVAAWFRFLRGVDFAGAPIEVKDRMRDTLQPLARRAGNDPRPLLAVRSVFGDLGEDEAFVAALGEAMRDLDERGPIGALESCLGDRLGVAA